MDDCRASHSFEEESIIYDQPDVAVQLEQAQFASPLTTLPSSRLNRHRHGSAGA